jgi:hypothetical protein
MLKSIVYVALSSMAWAFLGVLGSRLVGKHKSEMASGLGIEEVINVV